MELQTCQFFKEINGGLMFGVMNVYLWRWFFVYVQNTTEIVDIAIPLLICHTRLQVTQDIHDQT